MKKSLIITTLILGLLLAACQAEPAPQESAPAEAEPQELTHIRLPMGYIPNVQYAPFYAAVELGFFEKAGIEIEFDYSFETDGVALVGANELPFSVVSGEQVLMARNQGLPVTYVMAWYADYPVAVVSMADQNITTPEDLVGKRVGLPGTFGANYIGLRALLASAGLQESDITLDSVGFNQVEALVAGQDDAVVGYLANEPIQLQAQGYDVDVISVADYTHLVSNGLLTNEETIANNPELVRGMVEATLSGIRYTLSHPEDAYEIAKKYVDGLEDADIHVQLDILRTSAALYQRDPVGYSDVEAWENMQAVLLEMELIDAPLDLETVFTNDFIEE